MIALPDASIVASVAGGDHRGDDRGDYRGRNYFAWIDAQMRLYLKEQMPQYHRRSDRHGRLAALESGTTSRNDPAWCVEG